MRISPLLCFIPLLLLPGCGSVGSSTEAAAAPAAVGMKGAVEASSTVNNVTVSLNAGWNAVGLQCQRVTSLTAGSGVAGVFRWNGPAGYSVAELDGGARWVFASAPTSFTYSGTDPQPAGVDLPFNGYNLVSFCTNVDIPGSRLSATQNGQSVALGSVVLPQFYEIGPTNQSTPVDVLAGGVLKPGRAYWVAANTSNGPVRLNLAAPSPSPSPSALAVTALELSTVNTTVPLFQTVQFKLIGRLADGSSQDVTAQAQWTSQDPSTAALLSPGVFKGLNPFTTNVTATLNGVSAQATLRVEPASGGPGTPASVNRFVSSFPAGQVVSQCPNIAGPGLAQQTTFTSYPGYAFNYVMYPFTVPVSGIYNAEVTSTNQTNTGFFLRGRFTPGAPPPNALSDYFLACLASGPAPGRGEYLNMNLTAGQQYTYVMFFNTGATSNDVSTFNITGPGGAGIITN